MTQNDCIPRPSFFTVQNVRWTWWKNLQVYSATKFSSPSHYQLNKRMCKKTGAPPPVALQCYIVLPRSIVTQVAWRVVLESHIWKASAVWALKECMKANKEVARLVLRPSKQSWMSPTLQFRPFQCYVFFFNDALPEKKEVEMVQTILQSRGTAGTTFIFWVVIGRIGALWHLGHRSPNFGAGIRLWRVRQNSSINSFHRGMVTSDNRPGRGPYFGIIFGMLRLRADFLQRMNRFCLMSWHVVIGPGWLERHRHSQWSSDGCTSMTA